MRLLGWASALWLAAALGWQAKLPPPASFDFAETDGSCFGDYFDICAFQIAGATLYGPL